jgi:hypothetical protein
MQTPPSGMDAMTELTQFSARAAARCGTSAPVKPGNRIKFHWPPHPVSWEYHVHPTDWTGHTTLDAVGETFPVQVARTRYGVFGRCEPLWLEAKGDDESDMLDAMRDAAEPLFARQFTIAATIEQPGRFAGHVRDLDRVSLLKLLYCEDRDVAHEARVEIESHARDPFWLPCLIHVLHDRVHPHRRIAQWCVLDLFEGLPTFAGDSETSDAVDAIRRLIWDAEDDFARAIFKAGVVLGGHLPHLYGGPVLLTCLKAPSAIGRRSAIHGLFHVAEWHPEMRPRILDALREVAETDEVPELREYARRMRDDIEAEANDHVLEPVLPHEP